MIKINRNFFTPLAENLIKALVNQTVVEFTTRMKATKISALQANTVVEGDYEIRTIKATIYDIEEREDSFYIGYTPIDDKQGKFGRTHIPKNKETTRKYGVDSIKFDCEV